MAKPWTGTFTPPEQINGGSEYQSGDNIYTETFNVPINNSIWAANKAQDAVDQVSINEGNISAFKELVTARVNQLASQIVDGEGTQILFNGALGLRVECRDGNYYFTDTTGKTTELPQTKVAVGTYTGTGTYDSLNPNSLTLSFAPKLVVILCDDSRSQVLLSPQSGLGTHWYYVASTVYARGLTVLASGNTVLWYYPWGDAVGQANAIGYKYYYVAIG
jgi:hypothetical protein